MTTSAIEQFIESLEAMQSTALKAVRTDQVGRFAFGDRERPPSERPQIASILKLLLYPERRVPDVLASRMKQIKDFDIRARMAAQIFEEIRHARVLRKMLKNWGHDPDKYWTQPVQELVKIFDYIESLDTLAEFFSTFFVGEGLFLSTYLDDMRNTDPKAFSPYLEVALADEPTHIELARDALKRYATSKELQDKARHSASRLVEMFLGGYQARMREFKVELAKNEPSSWDMGLAAVS